MLSVIKLLHLAAAVVWMGGMAFLLGALRPTLGVLPPPQRLALIAAVLGRFFVGVWVAIGVLAASGWALIESISGAARGGQAMAAIGLVMFAVYAHLFFAPYRRLRRAVQAQDWAAAGAQVKAIARLATVNFVLGWIAIAAVRLA
jgi:uncharacterized membrane protein